MTTQENQAGGEGPNSEPLSVSTFSSGSTFGEDSYKAKFELEKERNRKLNEKLSGYRTVVNQFSKEQQERAQLKDKVAYLERILAEKSSPVAQHTQEVVATHSEAGHLTDKGQVPEEVLTELSGRRQSGSGSKTSHSPSFVVIQHSEAEDVLSPPHCYSQRSHHSAAPPLVVTTPSTITTVATGGVTITAWAGQRIKPTWQREQEGLVSRAFARSHHQPCRQDSNNSTYQIMAAPGIFSSVGPSNLLESNPAGDQSHCAVPPRPEGSVWTNTQDFSKAQTPPLLSTISQRTVEAREAFTSYSQTLVDPEGGTKLSPEGCNNLSPLIPMETSNQGAMGQEVNNIQEVTYGQPLTFDPMAPGQPLGVGARLKAKNTLCEYPLVNLFPPRVPSSNQDPAPGLTANQNQQAVESSDLLPQGIDLEKTSVKEVSERSTFKPSNILAPEHTADTLEKAVNELHLDQWANVTPEEEMKFPSLKSSPGSLPEDKPYPCLTTSDKYGRPVASVSTQKQGDYPSTRVPPSVGTATTDRPVLATPSDEDEHKLASQVHSMAATVGHQSGISDMLYRFAEAASSMEAKLMEYQAQIQRQQVQIQRHHSIEQEVQHLRKENESLLSYISGMQGQQRPDVLLPGGRTAKPVDSSPPPPPPLVPTELTKKLSSLEEINVRLFQANKEWFTKWEALRQQTRGEQKQLETRLQAYMADMEKLQKDVSSMEDQLKEAVTARQEEKKKNLELEQEKLNMMKKMEGLQTQIETLSREKRQLQAEKAVPKGVSGSKASDQDGKSYEDLKSRNVLLKQQVKVFHDDFLKEREDRTKAEAKVEKMRKEREAMKLEALTKSKKNLATLKTKEEDIRQKSKQLEDLQYQLDEIKQQLHQEQRKTQQTKVYQKSSSGHTAFLGSSTLESGVAQEVSTHTFPVRQPWAAGPQQPSPTQLSPEHLPGAWQCGDCTFINFPERSVCDICGWKNIPGQTLLSTSDAASGRGELKSRGSRGLHIHNLSTPDDVEPDSGDVEVKASTATSEVAEAR